MFASELTRSRREMNRAAHRCAATDVGLDAETRGGAVTLLWSQVTHARWVRSVDNVHHHLLIGGPSGEAQIPHERGDEPSDRLILALIRHLRAAGVPQAISTPPCLRLPTEASEPAHPEAPALPPAPLTLRPGAGLIALALVLSPFGLLMLFLPLIGSCKSAVVPGLLWLLGCGFAGWVGYHPVIRVDAEGISRRSFFGGTRVHWHEIACGEYSRSWAGNMPDAPRRLKDSQGRVLVDLAFCMTQSREWEQFAAFARVHAPHLLLTRAQPWKARPWQPATEAPT